MRWRVETHRIPVDHTVGGVTETVLVDRDVDVPVTPRDWDVLAVRAFVVIAGVITVGAMAWSTVSIGRLLHTGLLGFAVAAVFDLAWLAALLGAYIARFDPGRYRIADRAGWLLLGVSMGAVGWEGYTAHGVVPGTIGAIISLAAKTLWWILHRLTMPELSPEDAQWIAARRSRMSAQLAVAAVERQVARARERADGMRAAADGIDGRRFPARTEPGHGQGTNASADGIDDHRFHVHGSASTPVSAPVHGASADTPSRDGIDGHRFPVRAESGRDTDTPSPDGIDGRRFPIRAEPGRDTDTPSPDGIDGHRFPVRVEPGRDTDAPSRDGIDGRRFPVRAEPGHGQGTDASADGIDGRRFHPGTGSTSVHHHARIEDHKFPADTDAFHHERIDDPRYAVYGPAPDAGGVHLRLLPSPPEGAPALPGELSGRAIIGRLVSELPPGDTRSPRDLARAWAPQLGLTESTAARYVRDARQRAGGVAQA